MVSYDCPEAAGRNAYDGATHQFRRKAEVGLQAPQPKLNLASTTANSITVSNARFPTHNPPPVCSLRFSGATLCLPLDTCSLFLPCVAVDDSRKGCAVGQHGGREEEAELPHVGIPDQRHRRGKEQVPRRVVLAKCGCTGAVGIDRVSPGKSRVTDAAIQAGSDGSLDVSCGIEGQLGDSRSGSNADHCSTVGNPVGSCRSRKRT
jgi:hypothetical protein